MNNKIENLTVMKSRPLLSLWKSELTLEEFKILDTYLARIDSNNPDSRLVIFEKGELERLLGVKRIRIDELKKRINNLCQTIDVSNPLDHKHFRLVSLFEEAVATQGEDGLWKVKLECTQKAMEYIFNINKIGYLRYKLKYITSLKSRQSYILFQFLEDNRFRNPITIDLQTLKEILNVEDKPSYKSFNKFNEAVLKKTHNELNERTECKFDYEPIKKGRTVVAVKFILKNSNKYDSDHDIEPKVITQTTDLEDEDIDEWQRYESLTKDAQWIEDYCKCCEDNFTFEEMYEFINLTNQLPLSKTHNIYSFDDLDCQRMHYIQEKFNAFKVADSKSPIKNKYKYFKAMIENDIKEANK